MEAIEDSNYPSMSDTFSVYERYMRSFNVVDSIFQENNNQEESVLGSLGNNKLEASNGSNVELDVCGEGLILNQQPSSPTFDTALTVGLRASNRNDLDSLKPLSPCVLDCGSLQESSSVTNVSYLTEKSDHLPTSEDSKSDQSNYPKPVVITSLITMENSNNAVDSVPMFNVLPSDNVFKLPNSELSFNGTIKHVQKLRPIVDPITALTSAQAELSKMEIHAEEAKEVNACVVQDVENSGQSYIQSNDNIDINVIDDKSSNEVFRTDESESIEESNYQECKQVKDDTQCKWNEQSYSSLEGSFDSGVRSPDMFSEPEEEPPVVSNRWDYVKDYEMFDKVRVRKMEEILQGVLPPPSVTMLKIDVTEMLKKYHCFLPAFTEDANTSVSDTNSTTPTKLCSYIRVPKDTNTMEMSHDEGALNGIKKTTANTEDSNKSSTQLNTSLDNNVNIKMCSQTDAKEKTWPDVLKCRHYDVYYNVTQYSEKLESMALRCGERYVGAETETSVSVYSGGMQSPSSASKRKALRLKMASAKSPGRRLSHLARRRQAFCSAATIGEKAHASTAKMVLIDKNYFPHKKLINTGERKSPRIKRTPGKRTPNARKTPGKKTPSKTPTTRSGGSSKKKAMRRLLLDSDTLTRSQPTRETSKRALFISPENRKRLTPAPSSSVPANAMKSKRMLFGSPVRPAETKSLDGTPTEQFLKRKRDFFEDSMEGNRSKISKSFSFGGDASGSRAAPLARVASEMVGKKELAELEEHHRKKLLWAVTEALRAHGVRMGCAQFRGAARLLVRLVRRLLVLPRHAARLAAAASTSDTLLKIARLYVYQIIQGRSVEDCFEEERAKLSNESGQKVSGYISATSYQQIRSRQPSTSSLNSSQIKENTCDGIKPEQPKSTSKNVLQDKLINVDSNSNSSSLGTHDKASLYKSHSMPSFEEAAKMRARRQISFDNLDFPKR